MKTPAKPKNITRHAWKKHLRLSAITRPPRRRKYYEQAVQDSDRRNP
jgi:hypothetical protein